jgi:hypothetical protein
MSDNLTELLFLNKEKTIIQAKQNDTFITIEKDYDVYDLFDRVIAGEFGAIDETYIDNLEDELEKEDPIVISRLQAKAILLQYDLLDTVEALVAEQDPIVQLAWKEAVEFNASSGIINSLKPHIKWPDGSDITEEEWTELFLEASNLSFL